MDKRYFINLIPLTGFSLAFNTSPLIGLLIIFYGFISFAYGYLRGDTND